MFIKWQWITCYNNWGLGDNSKKAILKYRQLIDKDSSQHLL
jgi:hypothetical protein